VTRKATLDALFGKSLVGAAAPERKGGDTPIGKESLGAPNSGGAGGDGSRIRSGAIGAMGASLQQLRDGAREAEALKQSLAAGERIVSLDPALIDAAPVADRFRAADDEAIALLAESIRESGQQVPVLVRVHPAAPGRWQAAYGHRRIRACAAAGLPVKAIVRALSDDELAIAQGKENLERRDLSFIEKAYFAAGLDAAGHDRATIGQALGADKGDVSRFLALARAIPKDLAELIGPAPRTGRPRWQAMADALADRPARAQPLTDLMAVLRLLSGFAAADSDQRFRMVLQRLQAPSPAPSAAQAPAADPLLSDGAGRAVATVKKTGKRTRIDLDEALAPGFAAFLAEELPTLYSRWRSAGSDAASKQE
jgi:ParB family chromosome partitioning protein